MKSQDKGNIALGKAIDYFLGKRNTVSIPLNDAQPYDLIIDDGSLKKIQCKYTSRKSNGAYRVGLRVTSYYDRKNRENPWKFTRYKKGDFDHLYIFCSNGNQFLIPFGEISTKDQISVRSSFSKMSSNKNKYLRFKIN